MGLIGNCGEGGECIDMSVGAPGRWKSGAIRDQALKCRTPFHQFFAPQVTTRRAAHVPWLSQDKFVRQCEIK